MKNFVSVALISITACLSFIGCASTVEDDSAPEIGQAESALAGAVVRVVGDTKCPAGSTLASALEARANAATTCPSMGSWDIARLADGGSMDGGGYGCGIREFDSRSLGNSVCKTASAFVDARGDNTCPGGYTMVSPLLARAYKSQICAVMGTWDIARLAGGGSMDGSGYGCQVRDADSRSLGNTICAKLSLFEVAGDQPCAPGSALLTPEEARARKAEVCAKLGSWDIARLAGGGTMDGPGYGCGIRDWDTRGTGHALCKALR